jgi:hypothetical protein
MGDNEPLRIAGSVTEALAALAAVREAIAGLADKIIIDCAAPAEPPREAA